MPGTRLVDKFKPVVAFAPAVPNAAAPRWISLKNYGHVTVIVEVANGSSGVTPAALTLRQATAVDGTGAKALAFGRVFATTDAAASADLVETVVASNSYTVDGTVNKSALYAIEVDATTLDVNAGFDCFQLAIANAAAQTVGAIYVLGSGARYGGNVAAFPSPIVD